MIAIDDDTNSEFKAKIDDDYVNVLVPIQNIVQFYKNKILTIDILKTRFEFPIQKYHERFKTIDSRGIKEELEELNKIVDSINRVVNSILSSEKIKDSQINTLEQLSNRGIEIVKNGSKR